MRSAFDLGRWPLVLWTTVALPPLAFGAADPRLVAPFCLIVAGWWASVARGGNLPAAPLPARIGLLAAAVSAVQMLPIPGLRELIAPGLEAMIDDALVGSGIAAWPGLSPRVADTAVETARLLGLSSLAWVCATVPWWRVAGAIAAAATLGAAVGLIQGALGVHAIYGLYAPHDLDPAQNPALLGTFVNANHQAAFLLLGLGCTAAAMVHARGLAERAGEPAALARAQGRITACAAAIPIQIAAAMLCLSRASLVILAVLLPAIAVIAGRRMRGRAPLAYVSVLAAGIVFLGLGGPFAEVASLFDATDQVDARTHAVIDALGLIGLSPVFGIGAGGFVDLFPTVDRAPTHLLATHLECMPAALLVRLGPLAGGAIVLGLAWWWIASLRSLRGDTEASGPLLALLGLLALGVQSLSDFGLDLLGLSAPALALAGSLSARSTASSPRPAWPWPVLALVLAGLASLTAPGTVARLRVAPTRPDPEALRVRPLDAGLHLALARASLEHGRPDEAEPRAAAATRLHPASIDAHLLRAAVASAQGRAAIADEETALALEHLHEPATAELVAYLIARYDVPQKLAELGPTRDQAARAWLEGLRVHAPAHAFAYAKKRSLAVPDDELALRVLIEDALARANAALGLHYARLLHRARPEQAHAYVYLARAYGAFDPPRRREAIEALEAGLVAPLVDDEQRGRVEHALVAELIVGGDEAARERASELVPQLLRRPASREVQIEREQLAQRVRGTRSMGTSAP